MQPLNPRLPIIFESVSTSKRLEKMAQYFQDDPAVVAKVAEAKIIVDSEIFEMAKEAATINSELLRSALKAGAIGAGAALPVGGAAALLLSHAGSEARETSDNVRNNILLTGLGLAGTGAGMYGLHRLTGGGPIGGSNPGIKQAADQEAELQELTEKLAAVGALDAMLDAVPMQKLSAVAQKMAAGIRALNRGYGVQLLWEASHG